MRDNAPSSSGGPDCFGRTNFGLNGIVDARQCGVFADGVASHTVGTTTYVDVDLLQKCFTVASNSGYHIVTTGGGVVVDNTADIDVTDNITLTCGGTSVAAAASQDYRIPSAGGTLSKAIVLNPTTAGTPAGPFTVRLTGENSALKGCTVVAGAGPTGAENPYSPSIWFPGCDPMTGCGDAGPSPATFFRSELLEASAFNPNPTAQYNGTTACGATAPYHCGPASQSVGVTIDGANHATVREVAILGFGTCLQLGVEGSSSSPGAIVEQVAGDCNTGVEVAASNAPSLREVRIDPLLTRADFIAWKIDAIAQVITGTYLVTAEADASGGGFLLKPNDTVWVGTGIGGGRESARGRWAIGCTADSNGNCNCPTTCMSACAPGATCQQFSLTGSLDTPFSVTGQVRKKVDAAGHPPTAITNIALTTDPNLAYVAAGQKVSDSGGCIPANTTVTAVWPATGTIYMSNPATCGSTTEPITFTDNVFTPNCDPGADPPVYDSCLLVDAGFRFGDGFDVHNTGGLACYNCRSAEHMVPFHMNTGSNNAHLINSVTEFNVDLPDRNLWQLNLHGLNSSVDDDYDRQNIISLLIDGKHASGNPVPPSEDADACDVEALDSIFGQHRPVAIVVETQCNNQNRMANIGLGVDNTQANAIGFELDKGMLALSNVGGSAANSFVAGNTALAMSNVRLESQNLYTENSAAVAAINGCGSVFLSPRALNCPGAVGVANTVTADAPLDNSAEFWPCDATSSAVTLTVPPGSTLPNRTFRVTKTDSSTTHACTVQMSTGDSLNGATSHPLTTQYQSVTFINAGGTANWYIESTH